MEAVRTRPAESREVELPPPPAPFPSELLQDTRAPVDLAPIQQSCVQALSSLIPDSPDISSSPLPPLSFADSQLAQALTELLEVSYELEALRPRDNASASHATVDGTDEVNGGELTALAKELHELQDSASLRSRYRGVTGDALELHPSIGVVRETLAWARVDALSHAILDLVSTRQHDGVTSQARSNASELYRHGHEDGLPSYAQVDGGDQPPDYQAGHSTLPNKFAADKSRQSTSSDRSYVPSQEKMYRELDGLTTAIERLQHASPQLQEQRSEMSNRPRLNADVQARIERNKMRELEEIWRLIERSHGRRRDVDNTRVDAEDLALKREARRKRYLEGLLEQGEETRLSDQDAEMGKVNPDLARARDLRDRDRFLKELVNSIEGGRLDGQDAEPPLGCSLFEQKLYKQQALLAQITAQTDATRYKAQDYPETLETRLEGRRQAFIDGLVNYSSSGRMHDQDSRPPTPKQRNMTLEDPTGLVSMQDFFRETNGAAIDEANHMPSQGNVEQAEERKLGTFKKIAGLVRRGSLGHSLKGPTTDISNASYIAEHQENLLAVQVMFYGLSSTQKDDLIVETEKNVQAGCGVSEAIITSKRDASVSLRIALPTAVAVGQTVQFVQSDLHLETKLSALPTSVPGAVSSLNTMLKHPLSAPELRKYRPNALCCTACDRAVADLSRTLQSEDRLEGAGFKDLPSEHWAEMLEVWMCHDDPAFTAQLAQRTNEGFWPTRDTVLVGGSYLLVHSDVGKQASLQAEAGNNDTWTVLRCVCGEVLGKKRGKDEPFGSGTLRFSKWSIGLLREEEEGESVEPVRIPLSVFIMSDLLELAQAHATYRFVITDEDVSAPRLLIWLFNPSVKISYRKAGGVGLPSLMRSLSTGKRGSRSSQRSASVTVSGVKTLQAAKILYKVLDNGLSSDFVPGFGKTKGGQVESMSYPSEVCEGLISALRESNSVYPAGARSMLGLQVGFLERLW